MPITLDRQKFGGEKENVQILGVSNAVQSLHTGPITTQSRCVNAGQPDASGAVHASCPGL